MEILYLAADPVPSPKGAGVRIASTVETLVELGHDVDLMTLSGRDRSSSADDGEASVASPLPAARTHERVALPAGNYLERMLAFRRVAGQWLEGRVGDAVQFRGIWEGIAAVAWARRRGARVIFEAHGFPSVELPYHYPALAEAPGLIEKLIVEEGAVLREADLILTHSHTGRRYLLARGVPRERIAVLPNAVDPALFRPPAAAPPDEPPYRMVYVGTLAPWQGLTALVEALARFRRGAPLQLHLVGPTKRIWRQQIRSQARRARAQHLVRLAGATSQRGLLPVLQSAHVCVAPLAADPRNEVQGCSPIKVLEYMAAGRPILGTRVAPLLELLEHGRTAHLVMPGSPLALADGIAWMLAHPEQREQLAAAAREALLARFTSEHFRDRLAAAMQQLE